MAVNSKMKPVTLIAACGGVLTLMLAWGVVLPVWAQVAPEHQPGASASADSHKAYAPRHRFDRRQPNAEIDIYMSPQSEHWPSNYVPDNYRLDGYDGEPDRATLCRGESGTTYSTRTVECPDGQPPSQPARAWSTSP